jgi:hypothetical protein
LDKTPIGEHGPAGADPDKHLAARLVCLVVGDAGKRTNRGLELLSLAKNVAGSPTRADGAGRLIKRCRQSIAILRRGRLHMQTQTAQNKNRCRLGQMSAVLTQEFFNQAAAG